MSNLKLPITGKIDLSCTIAQDTSNETFHVCKNLPYDVIIGTDVLFNKQLLIDFNHKVIVSHVSSANFIFRPTTINFDNNVTLGKNITLEPNRVYFIDAIVKPSSKRMRNTLPYENYEGIFEPTNTFRLNEEVVIARSMNHSNNGLIKLQIANLSEKPIVLHKSRKLGKLTPAATTNDYYSCGLDTLSTNEETRDTPHTCNSDDIIQQLNMNIDSNNYLSNDQKSIVKGIMKQYSAVISKDKYDVGRVHMPHIDTSIRLTPDAVPMFIPERKIANHLKPIMEDLIKDMVDNNIAEPCEYSEWNSPVMLVAKKGSTPEKPNYRACVDLRYLNSCTVADSYSIPSIQNIFNQIGGAKYFSSFDATSGYHNIPLEKSSRHLTAFSFDRQQYMFKTLPQGAKNSGSKFCRVINRIYGRIPYDQIFAYIDDLLVCSFTFEEHVQKLKFVLETLQQNGLKINLKKAVICRPKCEFVGFTISEHGISISDSKLDAIRKLSPPTDYKSTQKFCGFINYVRNHCQNFAPIMKPIYALLDKIKKWEWTTECQEAYEQVISQLLDNAILHYPIFNDNPDNKFIVSVDSCSQGWGGMLEQMQNGKRVLISYWSKTMPKHKRELGSTRQEFIGIYHIIKHFREYLLGKEFDVHTDCKPLLGWQTLFSKGSSVQMRQINYLSEFFFNIIHVDGSSHIIPDYFSRQCLDGISVETQTETIDCTADYLNTVPLAGAATANQVHSRPKLEYLTSHEIIDAQKADPILNVVRKWVNDNKPPNTIQVVETPPELLSYYKQFSRLSMTNDILHRSWDNGDGTMKQLIVLPSTLIEKCLQQCHNSLESPHLGVDLTLDKIRQQFYFHNMQNETKLFVNGCITCARIKQPKAYQKPPLHPINIYHDFNDGIIIDHIGPMPMTQQGNQYILTFVDFFTGYVVATPCKSTASEETIKIVFNNWISRFGFFKTCHHDLGTGFTSKLFQAVLTHFDVEPRKGQPYSPTTQGKVESWNKKLKTIFKAVLDPENLNEWDKYINLVTFAINSTRQCKTGYSANKLVYGRELNQPSHIFLNSTNNSTASETTPHSTVAYNLHKTVNSMLHKTQLTINRMNKYAKTYYDKSANHQPFAVNDYCLILKHVVKHKYQHKWLGPYQITKCIAPYLYKIRIDGNTEKVVNIKIMKKFSPTKYTKIPRVHQSDIQTHTSTSTGEPASTNIHQDTEPINLSESDQSNSSIDNSPKIVIRPHKPSVNTTPSPTINSPSKRTDSNQHSTNLGTPTQPQTTPHQVITPYNQPQSSPLPGKTLTDDINDLMKHMTKNPTIRPKAQPTARAEQVQPTQSQAPSHDTPSVTNSPRYIDTQPVDYGQTEDDTNDILISPSADILVTDNQPATTSESQPTTSSSQPTTLNSSHASPRINNTPISFQHIAPRHSTRPKKAPNYLQDYIVGLLQATTSFISESLA